MSGHEKIAKILMDSLPRDFLLSFQRLFQEALERATAMGLVAHEGHRKSVVGHNRHFALNEALLAALDEFGFPHPALRGNAAMVGEVGILSVARIHMNQGKWDNSRRSKAKLKLCEPNIAISELVQAPLFGTGEPTPVRKATAMLVTQGDGSAAQPADLFIVVPNDRMDLRNPVFVEPLSVFLQRYQSASSVVDVAQPKLKAGAKRDDGKADSA